MSEQGLACKIEDCARPHEARGYCSLHYKRWKRTGDPDVFRSTQQKEEKLVAEGYVIERWLAVVLPGRKQKVWVEPETWEAFVKSEYHRIIHREFGQSPETLSNGKGSGKA